MKNESKQFCCKKLDLKKYDKKVNIWKNKLFYEADYFSFFYVPITAGI